MRRDGKNGRVCKEYRKTKEETRERKREGGSGSLTNQSNSPRRRGSLDRLAREGEGIFPPGHSNSDRNSSSNSTVNSNNWTERDWMEWVLTLQISKLEKEWKGSEEEEKRERKKERMRGERKNSQMNREWWVRCGHVNSGGLDRLHACMLYVHARQGRSMNLLYLVCEDLQYIIWMFPLACQGRYLRISFFSPLWYMYGTYGYLCSHLYLHTGFATRALYLKQYNLECELEGKYLMWYSCVRTYLI